MFPETVRSGNWGALHTRKANWHNHKPFHRGRNRTELLGDVPKVTEVCLRKNQNEARGFISHRLEVVLCWESHSDGHLLAARSPAGPSKSHFSRRSAPCSLLSSQPWQQLQLHGHLMLELRLEFSLILILNLKDWGWKGKLELSRSFHSEAEKTNSLISSLVRKD